MKILLASSSSGSRGGGELFLLYLGEALARRGHEAMLWASSGSQMDELAEKFAHFGSVARADYTNTYHRAGRSLADFLDFSTPRRIAEHWRQLAPDCIHVNKQNLEDGLGLLRATQLADTPAVCTIHLTQSARYLRAKSAGIRDFVARRVLQKARVPYVAVLENRERDLQDFLRDGANAQTITNGVPLMNPSTREALRQKKRVELGLDANSLLMVGVGRMMPQKRPLLWLETAEKIHTNIPNSRLIWIGDGPLARDWDTWVDAHGVAKTIAREPWQQDVRPFLAAADAFLHTAEYEGLPLAILEAMAAGLPCVVTDNLRRDMPFLTDENSIAICEENDGWFAPLRNRSALATRGEAARALMEQRFSCDAMAARYEALYEKVRAS